MIETSIFIEYIGDSPKSRILDYLMTNSELDFSISDIARNARVGRATLYNIWDDLIRNKILIHTRVIGKAKLYKLNKQDPKIKKLLELDHLLIMDAFKKVKKKQKILVKT